MEPVFTQAEMERITPAGRLPGNRRPGDHSSFFGRAGRFARDAGEYVKTHGVPAIAVDANRLVRRHPEASIAVAAALGFLVERVLFRKL
jgi:ElaB/YqjD/DUF883 family membrane-anchored ribosome-binding protein